MCLELMTMMMRDDMPEMGSEETDAMGAGEHDAEDMDAD